MSTGDQTGDEDVVGFIGDYCCCLSCHHKKRTSANNNNNDNEMGGGGIIEPNLVDSTVVCDPTTDRATLLAFMHIRYREKCSSYKYCANLYRRLDTFCFFIPLMLLQFGVSIIYAVGSSHEDIQRYFSGIASAVSAFVIAIQNRLKFGEASKQYRSGARQYSLLAAETFTKWLSASTMTDQQFQAFVRDTGQLQKEIEDTCPVPPDWVTTRFEKHRLILKRGDVSNNAGEAAVVSSSGPPHDHNDSPHDHSSGVGNSCIAARINLMQANRQQQHDDNNTRRTTALPRHNNYDDEQSV